MNMLSNYLSFEKPMGEVLTKFLFYVGIILIIVWGLRSLWHWITYFDNDWDRALWGVIWTPIATILRLLVLRVAAEFVLAVFGMMPPIATQGISMTACHQFNKSVSAGTVSAFVRLGKNAPNAT